MASCKNCMLSDQTPNMVIIDGLCEFCRIFLGVPVIDLSVECKECGINLSTQDMKEHDEVDCLAHLKFMRRYYNVIG